MITITIDGREIRTEPTKTIIEAAFENGIYVPHFCWHPALSISGNCRMCLVEVEKMPKQVIACSTLCTDGMVVSVNSDKAVQARHAVMEFILINHPLDCPICDEAGECKLQDYAYKYSVGESRFDEEKVSKRKRVELGPHVMFDAERCISCSRCIRFCEDVVGRPQLTFVNRGDRVTIETFPGEKLDNPYSMNVVDICPVGALTSREFRFKARVWDMSHTESICPGCARGCNVDVWVRQNEVMRLTPRPNPSVNNYWMCDKGRLESFLHVNSPARISKPLIRRIDDPTAVEWDEALSRVASDLRGFRKEQIAFIGSAAATCEENYLLRKFAREICQSDYIDVVPHLVPGDEDRLLVCADKTANAAGAELAGGRAMDAEHDLQSIVQGIESRRIQALVVMDEDVAAHPALGAALARLSYLLVLASHENETTRRADAVLPLSTFAEKDGTFVNVERHLQLLRPAVMTVENGTSFPVMQRSRLDKFASEFDRWGKSVLRDCRPAWMILTQLALLLGARWRYACAEDVFAEMTSRIPALKGLSYERIGRRGVRLGMGEIGTVPVYEDVHYA